LNGINSIRLDANTARYDFATARKRVAPLVELKTTTESDKKKQFKTELNNELGSSKKQSNNYSELLLSDRKYYRANLLSEIVNKMSGLDNRIKPGQFVEYYA
jgi:hypothetical protein